MSDSLEAEKAREQEIETNEEQKQVKEQNYNEIIVTLGFQRNTIRLPMLLPICWVMIHLTSMLVIQSYKICGWK